MTISLEQYLARLEEWLPREVLNGLACEFLSLYCNCDGLDVAVDLAHYHLFRTLEEEYLIENGEAATAAIDEVLRRLAA